MSFNPKGSSEQMTRVVDPFVAMKTMATRGLYECFICLDLPECPPISINSVNRAGQMLAERRTEQGISQLDLARIAGVNRTTISEIEAGKRGPSLETIIELAHALDYVLTFLPSYAVPFSEQLLRVLPAPSLTQKKEIRKRERKTSTSRSSKKRSKQLQARK